MEDGESTSQHSATLKDVLAQSPTDSVFVSPTLAAYLDPPPTYHHATETAAAGTLSGESTEEENIPSPSKTPKTKKWPRNETTTSIITTTTTTTTTTSHTTSASTSRPNLPPRVSSSSLSPSTTRRRSKSNDSLLSTHSKTSSDPYLDALLARSVAALELSNALLQSTLATKSTLSSVLAGNEALEKRERAFEERLLRSANPYYMPPGDPGDAMGETKGGVTGRLAIEEREGKKMEWMREMESIIRDVEELFDTNTDTSSAHHRSSQHDGPRRRRKAEEGGLVLGDHSSRTRSPPPRALTQYVSITGANAAGKSGGFATEETADKNSIYMPSTTGLMNGPHREPLGVEDGRRKRGSSVPVEKQEDDTRVDPIPSTNSGVRRYLTASNSATYPATHPESLPLSPQELLQLYLESVHAGVDLDAGSRTTADRHDQYAYLRKVRAHSGTPSVSSDGGPGVGTSRTHVTNISANTSLSGSLATPYTPPRPDLSPRRPSRNERIDTGIKGQSAPRTPTTYSPILPLFPSNPIHSESHQSRIDHSRTESTATTNSTTSNSAQSSRSSARSSLSLGNLSFSLPLPSSISAALRRSPSLRGMGSPTSTEGSICGSDAAEGGQAYSPALEVIEDFEGEGEDEDVLNGDNSRGRNRKPTAQSPTRGRAILRGRFRTADTLRRILNTSPSPLPSLYIPRNLTSTSPPPSNIASSQRATGFNTRSNTDSSDKTIRSPSRRIMRGSFASAESLSLAIPNDYTLESNKKRAEMHSTPNIPVPSSIPYRSYSSARSPSTVSSASDLHSDMDGRTQPLSDSREAKRRLKLRPAPRFMPRTPGGRTAQLEVSGATARAPVMHAHLIEPENSIPTERSENEAAIGDLSPLPPVGDPLPSSASPYLFPAIPTPPKPSTPAETTFFDQSQQERQRAQSLSASISTIISQKRALENVKLANAGKVKGGSSLKGSPAWNAQRQLHGSVELTPGVPAIPRSTSNASQEGAGSGPSSKRASWIGNGLLGLGLAITPSSSANASTGTNTPPLRVSFAKEPVRYSEERESRPVNDEEEEADADTDAQGLQAGAEGGLTIKPRSIRRTRSWNGSVKGASSGRVPSKKRNTGGGSGKEKKEGWLEWFLGATTASPSVLSGHMGVSAGSMGIGRDEMFESRGRDDW